MELESLIGRTITSASLSSTLVAHTPEHQARWKPDAANWSILDVIDHLAHEEVDDFRVWLNVALHRPGDTWPSIDPAGWVTLHRYNEQDLESSPRHLASARDRSLTWLRERRLPDWEASTVALWGPEIRTGHLMAARMAHDLLHVRQLVELQWAHLTPVHLTPYDVAYAGEW